MRVIEKLWDKAKDDPQQQEIRQALVSEMTVICSNCGGEDITRDGTSGCCTCQNCGAQDCGDG